VFCPVMAVIALLLRDLDRPRRHLPSSAIASLSASRTVSRATFSTNPGQRAGYTANRILDSGWRYDAREAPLAVGRVSRVRVGDACPGPGAVLAPGPCGIGARGSHLVGGLDRTGAGLRRWIVSVAWFWSVPRAPGRLPDRKSPQRR